ncbi:MAG: hypothetical protein E7004_06850 [Alphaproteobacteria bacterium]|nr:hypothetical protein [Alphaproteobacteria bacterium]
MRSNLLSLRNIATQMSKTQNILSTGKKVNNAIDNATSYYQARSLTHRAADLNSLLDSMSQGIQTIKAAVEGLESGIKVLEQAKAVVEEAIPKSALDIPSKTWLKQQGCVLAVVSSWEELKQAVDSGGVGDIVIYGRIDCQDTLNLKDGQNLVGVDSFGRSDSRDIHFSALTFHDFGSHPNAIVLNGNNQISNLFLDFSATSTFNNIKISENSSVKMNNVDIQSYSNSGYLFMIQPNVNLEFTGENNIYANKLKYVFGISGGDGDTKKLLLNGDAKLNISATGLSNAVFHTMQTIMSDNSELNIFTSNKAFYGGKGHFYDNSRLNVIRTGTSTGAPFTREFSGSFYDKSQLVLKGGYGLYGWNSNRHPYNIKSKDVKIILDTSKSAFYVQTGGPYISAVEGAKIQTSAGVFEATTNISNMEIKPSGSVLPAPFVLVDSTPANAEEHLSDKVKEMRDKPHQKIILTDFSEQNNDSYLKLLNKYDDLIKDCSYQGKNLLTDDKLDIIFNETRSGKFTIDGQNASVEALGFDTKTWITKGHLEDSIYEITEAIKKIRTLQSELGNKLSIIQTRQSFTDALVDVLEVGADKLVLADMNEVSAEYLTLQTRQQLAVNSLSLASQSTSSVLGLFL